MLCNLPTVWHSLRVARLGKYKTTAVQVPGWMRKLYVDAQAFRGTCSTRWTLVGSPNPILGTLTFIPFSFSLLNIFNLEKHGERASYHSRKLLLT